MCSRCRIAAYGDLFKSIEDGSLFKEPAFWVILCIVIIPTIGVEFESCSKKSKTEIVSSPPAQPSLRSVADATQSKIGDAFESDWLTKTRSRPIEIPSRPYPPAEEKNKTTIHDVVGRWVTTPVPMAPVPKPTPVPKTVKEPEQSIPGQGRPQFSTLAEAQKAAVEIYPDLGIAGSKLNNKFIIRYKQYQVMRPEFFRDPSWPLRLAEEITLPSQ